MKRFSHLPPVSALSLSAVLFMAVLFCLPGQALAAKRVALVVGNGNYAISPLRNPVNDAKDVARTLGQLGFDVILKTNADKRNMVRGVSEFGRKAQDAEVAFFFYAGHGIQCRGANYLIPVGARVDSEVDVEFEAMEANRVLAQMERAGAKVNIVVLDACRDNPFRSFRSAKRGLAVVRAVSGSVIVYATAPGDVAADGSGRNSPFTRHLLDNLGSPGLTVIDLFNRVGEGVSRDTKGRQSPWISSSLYKKFYLVADGSPTPPAPTGRQASLKIETQPSGATVYVNGSRKGAAPVNVTNVSPGRVTVRAVKSGYKTMEKTVRLEAGQSMYLPLALDREAPQTARLTVRPDPSGARVRILNIGSGYRDGMELTPGRYHVEVTKSGYEKFSSWVTLGAGENMVMPVDLKVSDVAKHFSTTEDVVIEYAKFGPYRKLKRLTGGETHIKFEVKPYNMNNQVWFGGWCGPDGRGGLGTVLWNGTLKILAGNSCTKRYPDQWTSIEIDGRMIKTGEWNMVEIVFRPGKELLTVINGNVFRAKGRIPDSVVPNIVFWGTDPRKPGRGYNFSGELRNLSY